MLFPLPFQVIRCQLSIWLLLSLFRDGLYGFRSIYGLLRASDISETRLYESEVIGTDRMYSRFLNPVHDYYVRFEDREIEVAGFLIDTTISKRAVSVFVGAAKTTSLHVMGSWLT